MDYMKADRLGAYRWRILAIPFGGQFRGGRDLDGEFFSPRTDIKPDWFAERPVLWHHGKDDTLKDSTLGVEDDLVKSDEGWWATLWLDRGARYVDAITKMLAAGKAFGSSGSIAHLVRIDRASGEILTWPHAEQTLSTMPTNLLSRVVPAKAIEEAYEMAGLAIGDAVKASLAEIPGDPGNLPADLPPPARAATGGGADAARIGLAYGRTLNLERRVRP